MEKLTLQDVAAMFAAKSGLEHIEAVQFITVLFDAIRMGVNDDKLVKIKGLGTFKVVGVEARESVNVNTGERLIIDSHAKISFTPDVTMRELVNKPFSGFETVALNDGVTFDDMPSTEALALVEDEEATTFVEEDATSTPAQEEDVVPVVEEPEPVVVEPEPVVEEPAPVVEETTFVVEEPAPVVEEPAFDVEEPEPDMEEPPVVPEQIPEPKLVSEPAPEPVSEPVSEPKSEPEPVPIAEPAAEPASKPEAAPVSESEPLIDFVEEEAQNNGWWKWLLLAVLACGASFGGGYWLGMHHSEEAPATTEKPAAVVADTTQKTPVPADSTTSIAVAADSTQQTQPAVTPEAKAETASADESYKKYEEMDSRVRTGAYRIVGTDQVVKARPGDTPARVSRRYLGAGMECYFEVYNGITSKTELTAGQELKVPKLEVKKKMKK